MKRVGIVVDGHGEREALAALIARLRVRGVQLLPPIYADMQPKASAAQIVKAASARIDILIRKGATKILVLVDLEIPSDCAAARARDLRMAFKRMQFPQVYPVIKRCSFENWLIADPRALAKLNKRFRVSNNFQRQVSPDKADNVLSARELLDHAALQPREYHKRVDAIAIVQQMDITEVARNSRSFRRFLHLLGHPDYSTQSRSPAE